MTIKMIEQQRFLTRTTTEQATQPRTLKFNGLVFTERVRGEWIHKNVVLSQFPSKWEAYHLDYGDEIDAIGLGDTPEEALRCMGADLKRVLAPLNRLVDQLMGVSA